LLDEIVNSIVEIVNQWGYSGIVAAMFLESSFFPFPSEVIMLPAGYLSHRGDMNIFAAICAGIAGSMAGAALNYYIAHRYGRRFFLKYGRYIGFDEKSLGKIELFFEKHGEISTFNGRLIPGVRQYISFPAGLAGMSLGRFFLYTGLGAGLWVSVLAVLGYYAGANEEYLKRYLDNATYTVLLLVLALSLFYWIRSRAKGSR